MSETLYELYDGENHKFWATGVDASSHEVTTRYGKWDARERGTVRTNAFDSAEAAAKHMHNYHIAHRNSWQHCPEEDRGYMGNHIAWDLYRDWGSLDEDLRAFAIETARAAVKAMPSEPDILDTLACCLFSAGETEEAVQIMRRCIQLEPDEPLWQQQLEMFLAEEI